MAGSGGGCPTRPRRDASGPSLTWPRGAREASAERLLGVASRPGPRRRDRGGARQRLRSAPVRSDGQRPAGARPPPPGGSARPGRGERSSGWVTPTQRPAAASTVNVLVPSDRATTSGRRTSASSDASTAASMAAWSVLWKSGVKPQRFMETRASGESMAGSRPSSATEAAVAGRRAPGAARRPRGAVRRRHPADPPGHGREADHGVGQPVADQRVGVACRPAGARPAARSPSRP